MVRTPEAQVQTAGVDDSDGWLIALPEYAFQVPANRLGAERFTVTQLKIMQECITLVVFTVVAFLLFGERPSWNIGISYLLIVGAVYFAFRG